MYRRWSSFVLVRSATDEVLLRYAGVGLQERGQLTAAERRLGELIRLGVVPSNGQSSPTCSSDTEEVHHYLLLC